LLLQLKQVEAQVALRVTQFEVGALKDYASSADELWPMPMQAAVTAVPLQTTRLFWKPSPKVSSGWRHPNNREQGLKA
jgi:hypothetical protein